MIKLFLSFIVVCVSYNIGFSQNPIINPQDTVPIRLYEKRYNEKYAKNIRKSRINGVYIPKDLYEAHSELQSLSKPESINKFKNAEKEFVVGRLHYSLGRWMILNWNFYDGSRYSNYLKELGLSHPDDMARFTLLTLHDVLNNIEPDLEGTVNKLVEERKLLLKKD